MNGQYLVYFFHGAATFFFSYNTYLLLKIKERTRLQTLLCTIFIFWTLSTLLDFFFYTELVKNEQLSTIILMIDTLLVPICSFFVLELVSPKWFNYKKAIYILLPFMAMTVTYIFYPTQWYYAAFLIYTIIFSIIILLVVGFAATRYNKYILKNYSYNENMNVKWIFLISILLFIILMFWTVTSYSITWLGDCVYYISSVILWIIIMDKTNKHTNVFITNNLAINRLLKVDIEECSEKQMLIEESFHFEELLKEAFEQKQLHLNPKLTINDVARSIGTNRTYLSSYLNNELKITFYDFINSIRIERKAKQLLKEKNINLTIDEIAQQSGFNSLSTFRRAFIKHTGKTPNDFRKTNF